MPCNLLVTNAPLIRALQEEERVIYGAQYLGELVMIGPIRIIANEKVHHHITLRSHYQRS